MKSKNPAAKAAKRKTKCPRASDSRARNDYLLSGVFKAGPVRPDTVPANLPIAMPDHGTTDGSKGKAIRSGKKVKGKRVKGHKGQ